MTPGRAEEIAIEALVWIAGQEDLGRVFLGATGAAPDDLRARAEDPVFLVSVLEFLTMDDQWVIAFCEAGGHEYAVPMSARKTLVGPGQEGWD